MRGIALQELRELLQSPPFTAWWAEYAAAREAEREAAGRHARLEAQHRLAELEAEAAQRHAIDTFSSAGEAEGEAARAGAEAQAHEVRALEQVGRFEQQRQSTSDVWYRLGGAERTLELRREALAQAGAGPEGDRARAQAETALRAAERQLRGLQAEYAEEDRKRSRLWSEVEVAWDRSFERSLLAAEHTVRSRRIIREAEQLFREAEERRGQVRRLREEFDQVARALAEAGRRRAALLEAAAERFGCLAGQAFLFFRHAEDQRAAWAVALQEEAEGFNLPLHPLEVFTVRRGAGVAFLEPPREGLPVSVEQGDRRFDDYFLGPRRAPRREEGAPAAQKVEEK